MKNLFLNLLSGTRIGRLIAVIGCELRRREVAKMSQEVFGEDTTTDAEARSMHD